MVAAQHQHRALHLHGIDQRQLRGHVEIGAGRHLVAELQLEVGERLGDRRVVAGGQPVAGEDQLDHGAIAQAGVVGLVIFELLGALLQRRRVLAFVGEGGEHQAVDPLRLRLRIGAGPDPPDEVP